MSDFEGDILFQSWKRLVSTAVERVGLPQIRTRHCAGYDVVAVNRPNEPTVRYATKSEAEAAAVEWLLDDGYDSAEQSPSEFLDAHADVVQVREGRVA